VTVVDTTKPIITFVPPPVALNDCKAADLGTPSATDDCAGTPTFTNDAPPIFPLGQTVVTWTATDASGNHSAPATQTVTVVDTVPPTVSCLPDAPDSQFQVISTDVYSARDPIGRLTLANANRS
jgi:hypothetical protein